jgi:hypothetical protein
MATSASTNYTVTRDDVIKRALRIIGAIGQGETPPTDAVTEAAVALNQIVKEWNADGMQLWKYLTTTTLTLVSGTRSYNIGVGATFNMTAPLKITQAWLRNTAQVTDTPINLITRQEYDMLSSKGQLGRPNQLYYVPPGAVATEQVGTIYLYPAPDTDTATNYTLLVTGMTSLMDFDAAADTADFPSFYYNALAWALADQLSYEYGVPYAQQAMITKKAEVHKEKALGFDREEGSLYLQPDWSGRSWS